MNQMIDPFERGKAWFMYSELEKEFIETISYVALETAHNDVWSQKYSGLLVRIGDMIDSFFRYMVNSKSLDNEKTVQELRGKITKNPDWHPDISDFRKTFNSLFELSNVEVETEYGLTYYGKLYPYKDFDRKSPPWWDSYNDVKHKIFEQIEKGATLGNTLNALASLFVLNILHKENQQYLIRYTNNVFFAEYLGKEQMERCLMKSFIGVPVNYSKFKFITKTPLFTHILRVDKNAKA